MISPWHHTVVCPSVCNAVHCGAQGRYWELKVVPSCSDFLVRHFLFTSSDTFAVRCIV